MDPKASALLITTHVQQNIARLQLSTLYSLYQTTSTRARRSKLAKNDKCMLLDLLTRIIRSMSCTIFDHEPSDAETGELDILWVAPYSILMHVPRF